MKDRKYEDFIHGAIGKPGIPQLRRTLKNERVMDREDNEKWNES